MDTKYRLVGCMATMPSRAHTAPEAIKSLIAQFDKFYLILNSFEEIPQWARLPGVTAILPGKGRDYGAAGKFLGLSYEEKSENTM